MSVHWALIYTKRSTNECFSSELLHHTFLARQGTRRDRINYYESKAIHRTKVS